MDSIGGLLPLDPAGIFTGNLPCGITVNSQGTFAYVINRQSMSKHELGTISQYKISHNGRLISISDELTFAGYGTKFVTASPNGDFLYVVNELAQTISQYRINSDGTLEPLSIPSVSANLQNSGPFLDKLIGANLIKYAANPCWLSVHPNSKFAYVAKPRGSRIGVYQIDNGILTNFGSDTVGYSRYMSALAISFDGCFLYGIGGGFDTVSQYLIGINGELLALKEPFIETTMTTMSIVSNPKHPVVYVGGASKSSSQGGLGISTISQYGINKNGRLKPLVPHSLHLDVGITSLITDQQGDFLFALSEKQNLILIYSIHDGKISTEPISISKTLQSPSYIALLRC